MEKEWRFREGRAGRAFAAGVGRVGRQDQAL